MRVIVTGSRIHDPGWVAHRILDWHRRAKVQERITLIHGDAPGADQGAHLAAERGGFNEYRFPAEWAALGKAAGVIRNVEMLEEMPPDLVLAFPVGESKGTRHMIREAVSRSLRVEVIEVPDCYCGEGVEGHDPRHAWSPGPSYVFIERRRCKGCGAPMVWWQTAAGKMSPHDLDGVSHFATCPVQQQFRARSDG